MKAIILLAIIILGCAPKNNTSDLPTTTKLEVPGQTMILDSLLQNTDLQAFEQIYGRENITSDSTITNTENKKVRVSYLYPNTNNQVALYWKDKEFQKKLASIEIAYDSTDHIGNWQTSHGLQLGMSLSAIETINAKPFSISGFGWAYAGSVVSWEGGKLDHQGIGLSFSDANKSELTPTEFAAISGQTEFYTNHESIKKLNPKVSKIWLGTK